MANLWILGAPALNRPKRALDRFVAAEPSRSIAVTTFTGPEWSDARDGDVARPAASLLKVPLVLAVLGAARSGVVDLDQTVRRRELPDSRFPSVIDVLDGSHALTLRELCGIALATSDNPAAEHLLGLVGHGAVNRVLGDLGCSKSRLEVGFADAALGPMGRANVTTASDMLRLLRHIHESAELAVVARGMQSALRATGIPLRLPDDGSVVVAHKTGSLAGVVNDVGVVESSDVTFAVAVLCDGQRDPAVTNIDIGHCVLELWSTLAGRLES